LVVGGLIVGGTVGYFVAKKVDMTALPQLVAAFHSLVGLAAVFIAVASFIDPQSFSIASDTGSIPQLNLIEMSLGTVIGAITFAGSLIAFGKLQGIIGGAPLVCSCQHKVNALVSLAVLTFLFAFVDLNSGVLLLIIILLSLYLGIFLVLPIGGADMPVVVSMLNSYSGWAAAGIGFTLDNNLLIITGALVGASGAILSYIMCKGMNRSLISVILGGKVTDQGSGSRSNDGHVGNVKLCSFEDAAFIIRSSNSVVIVPGYGMAVAQAQHVIREISDVLKEDEILVRYAIHPVAGRMPGHMNVLLAEANIPYDDVLEIDEINHDFGNTDVAIVIGANDITNPSAKTDPTSSIYGMPILDVAKARTVLFVKRSLGAGYAGVDNPLFYQSNTMMILGDAKKVCESILRSLKESR
jgi:NAD(P) transhydrogenase subunit beta